MIKNQKRPKGIFGLFARVRDTSRPIEIDRNQGVQRTPVAWKEMAEINLGSINKPNKDIFDIKMIWEPVEPDGKRMSRNEFFHRFFTNRDELDEDDD